MTDHSFNAQVESLAKRRDQLKIQQISTLPKLNQWDNRTNKVLDLLNDSQYLCAALFGEFQLVSMITEGKMIGLLPREEWFEQLDTAQRSQVIDYFNTLLENHGYQLVWFSRGSQNGYMFEHLNIPVVSR